MPSTIDFFGGPYDGKNVTISATSYEDGDYLRIPGPDSEVYVYELIGAYAYFITEELR